ncbi:MAG: molybdate ABC transporter substrate-binding protein [Solirubrobacterales bacterium]
MRRAALSSAVLLLAAAGCGDDSDAAAEGEGGELIVSAASSLEPAFSAYAGAAGIEAKQSFAGSDDLAAQIRQGVRPDLYAAANTSLPEELHAAGLVGEPVVFATNELVLAVPAGPDAEVDSVGDLAAEGVTIAIGDEGVPVGDYAREVLAGLGDAESDAILANVRSLEPDVAGIVGKLTQGAVDAGFVYVTDVVATGGELEAIELPPRLRPAVAYGAAVVDGAENPQGAERFIAGLLEGDGAAALRAAGFRPPPG